MSAAARTDLVRRSYALRALIHMPNHEVEAWQLLRDKD
jgi:hypothetical protein